MVDVVDSFSRDLKKGCKDRTDKVLVHIYVKVCLFKVIWQKLFLYLMIIITYIYMYNTYDSYVSIFRTVLLGKFYFK